MIINYNECDSSSFIAARNVIFFDFSLFEIDFFLNFIPRLYKSEKKIYKNMRITIIDVKFDEESKSEVRIGLPCKEKPENAENCRKIIKLLFKKNDVKKYLLHQ